jgi:cytochrome c-type biogenesis protein CcmH
MILFWITCAVFVAIALAFVIPPLLPGGRREKHSDVKAANVEVYRDQLSELDADLQNGIVSKEQYQQDRDEIERRLLDDVAALGKTPEKKSPPASTSRTQVYAIALLIPFAATAVYLRVGNPGALNAATASAVTPISGARPNAPMSQQDIANNVAKLAKRMEENPGDANGWAMLGRSYLTMQKYNEAAGAYAKATALKQDDADLWADYAFAAGMANNKSLLGPPTDHINKALAIDPDNPKALELAGSAAYEAKNYQDAIGYWQRLLDKTPKQSELAQALIERIEQAKAAAK